jgi:dCTP deaminase
MPVDRGILPDRMIAALAKRRWDSARARIRIRPDPAREPRPASRRIAYRVRASFLPRHTTVAERIEQLKLHEIALGNGAVLETGCVYIVPLLESLALPSEIAAAANPKSSTGRLDVFTRVITDHARGFDRIEPGYHGPLYARFRRRRFRCWCAKARGCRSFACAAATRRSMPSSFAALHARERLVDSETRISRAASR